MGQDSYRNEDGCLMIKCVPKPCAAVTCPEGFDLVGADDRGCGGDCVKRCPEVEPCPEDMGQDSYRNEDGCLMIKCVPKPCAAVTCPEGFDLVGADDRGCGGDCVKRCPEVEPCPEDMDQDSYRNEDGCFIVKCLDTPEYNCLTKDVWNEKK